jgi:hypothetical protein
MAREHQSFDMCLACLGNGELVRVNITVENGRRVMRFDSRPCGACGGQGYLRGTGQREGAEDDEELGPEDWST